jgi:glucans biosynthesis protein C
MKNLAGVSGRLFYLDWLRVLAMGVIFFHHNARFFNAGEDWHVKNATTNIAASIAVTFNGQWIMPLFFLIAGAGTYYSLKIRSSGQYAGERVWRLLIPFIFGILVILVPQAYYDAIYHGTDLGGYNLFQIYWLYLQALPNMQLFHLWYLRDLFLFSVITIPLFFTRNREGKSVIARLAAFFDRPWTLIPLFVLIITVVNVLIYPDGFWGYRTGGWNIITYVLFFIFGYFIFSNPHIMVTIKKLRWASLAFGVASFTFIFLYVLISGEPKFGTMMYDIGMLVQALGTWGWLFTILAFGSLYLNRNARFLSYANEAVLPFYILHQTIIIVIGYYIVQWDTGVGLKYLAISTTSFIVIMLIYETLVKRFNVLRFLFGMKLKRVPRAVLLPGDR